MDYKKIYNSLMETRLELKSSRLEEKKLGAYFEGHHIIPKSKGGSGNSNRPKNNSNIVLLTAREHFLAHWLLWRIYRDRSMALAFHKMMSNNKNQSRKFSSKGYEEARLAFSETNKGNQYGKGRTRIASEEQKKKQSEAMKGRYIGDNNPSKKPGVGEKISKKLKGRKKNKEHIEKLTLALKNRPKLKCIYCNIECDDRNYKRWHGDACKMNPNGHETRSKGLAKEKNPMYGRTGEKSARAKTVIIEYISGESKIFVTAKEASNFLKNKNIGSILLGKKPLPKKLKNAGIVSIKYK